MKKIFKYLALVPLLTVLIFNCIIYGSVYADDYSSCLVSFSQSSPKVIELFDYRDFHSISSFSDRVTEDDDYLYFGIVDKDDYSDFISGNKNSIKLTFYLYILTDISIYSSDYSYYITDTIRRYSIYYNINISTGSVTKGNSSHNDNSFEYFPDSFYVGLFSGTPSTSVRTSSNSYTFVFDSSVFEKKHEAISSNSNLNVSVSFSPELTGAFSRTRYENGFKITLDNFNFTVTNNSKFSIQYLMAIYRDDEFFRPFNDDPLSAQAATKFNGKTYTGNPTYVYVKDEWIHLPHGTQGVITANAPSSWHYLQSGEAESVTVAFNQIKLDINVNYTCVVYAIRNDSNYATVFSNYNSFQYPACSDYCVDVSGLSCVYSSQFNILNPAEFNPNNNDNSYAFDVDDSLLFNRANGYIDENGEVVVDRVDTNSLANAGKDPNDPWNGYNPDHNAWEVYYKNQNTVSSDIDQLSNNFSSFLQFVNKVFSYFPKNYQNIIILGLTSIVVIGILKVVF